MKSTEFFKQPININQPQATDPHIVDDLIPFNRLVVWASAPGEGKSLIAMGALYHVAYDAPFVGFNVTPGNVLFIDSENPYSVLKPRADKITTNLERQGYKQRGEVCIQHYSGLLLEENKTWQPVVDEIKVIRPSIILLDHLAMFHFQNENKSGPMNIVADGLEELMQICGSTILVLHHFNKNQGNFSKRLRGSSAIYARSHAAWEVRTLSRRAGGLEKVGLIPQTRKDITCEPIRIRIEEGQDWMNMIYDGTFEPLADPSLDSIAHDYYHIFLDNPGEKTVEEIIQISAKIASDTEIREILRLLHGDKMLLARDRRGLGGTFHYKLINPVGQNKCPWCGQVV